MNYKNIEPKDHYIGFDKWEYWMFKLTTKRARRFYNNYVVNGCFDGTIHELGKYSIVYLYYPCDDCEDCENYDDYEES